MTLRTASWAAAAAGGVGCAALGILDPERFFPSYLVVFVAWTGISVGSLGLRLLHDLVGGAWGREIRPALDAAIRTVPLTAVLFLPILLGLDFLYPWARPEEVRADEVLRHKTVWFNIPFFAARAAIVFGSWILLARARRHAGPALVVLGLTVTFASIDWTMSLEPRGFSSITGLLALAGHALAALSFSLALGRWDAKVGRDLGNLLLAFVMLWSYLAFSQYLILWSANLPEEVPWILHRTAPGWRGVALGLVLLHFAVPFLLLLSRGTKADPRRLVAVAALVLAMRLVDAAWQVLPSIPSWSLAQLWTLAPPLVAVGGSWLAVFGRSRPPNPPAEVSAASPREVPVHG